MFPYENNSPVLTGYWLYANSIKLEVRIVKHNILYGTGDYEDSIEIANDQKKDCFYVLFQTTDQTSSWTGGGGALTLEEAKQIAERAIPTVSWI